MGSNHKSGRLMEVCIIEWAVVLDTRWEQINWLNDITYTQYKASGQWRGQTRGQTRQLAGQWIGQTRAGWMTSPSARTCLEVNGEDGLEGK